MAASSLKTLTLHEFVMELPNGARVEDFVVQDSSSTVTPFTSGPVYDRHIRAVFPALVNAADGVLNPELVAEFLVGTSVTGATGFTFVFQFYCELPVIVGNVVWEVAAMRVQSATTGNTFNTDSWGTPTVASAQAVPGTAGQFQKMSVAIVNANIGGGGNAPVAGDLLRIRIRRLNGNASDSCKAPVYIIGGCDVQNT